MAPLGYVAAVGEAKSIMTVHAAASMVMAICLWVLCGIALAGPGLTEERYSTFTATSRNWYKERGSQLSTPLSGLQYASAEHALTQDWAGAFSLMGGVVCFLACSISVIVLSRTPGSCGCSLTLVRTV